MDDSGVMAGFTALASALVHSVWQDALLGVTAAFVMRAGRRASAAWRHNAGMAFLIAMAVVPALQFLQCWQESMNTAGLAPLSRTMPGTGVMANLFGAGSSWAAALVTSWLLGVGMMVARHVSGLRAIGTMVRSAHQPLPARWQRRVDELCRALGIARDVAVRVSSDVLVPCTARLIRPVVWLPVSFVTGVPAPQLEALLAHELAHIARKDWLWHGLQCVIESLLFFHPAVWWLGRRIRQEREHACDDLAARVCGDALPLAEALVALERGRHLTPRLALAAHGGSLVRRIGRLLSEPPVGRSRSRLALAGAMMFVSLLLIAQLGISIGDPPDLIVRASTAGTLATGDFREIRDLRFGMQRFYRATVDEQGRLVESYWQDGRPYPIDSHVRRWIEDPPNVPPAR